MVWTVVLNINVVRSISQWDRRNRNELLAIKRLLENGGPGALDWDVRKFVGAPSWEELREPYGRGYWTAFEDRLYWLRLEILPGRAIRISDVRRGVSSYRRH